MNIKIKNGKPLLYQPTPLPGWEILGEISRQRGGTGALGYCPATGLFAQIGASVLTRLDERAVATALLTAWQEENAIGNAEAASRFGVSLAAVNSWRTGRRPLGGAALKLLLSWVVSSEGGLGDA